MIFNCENCKEINKYNVHLVTFNIINNLVFCEREDLCLELAIASEFLSPIKNKYKDNFILKIPFSITVKAINGKTAEYEDIDEAKIKEKFEKIKNEDLIFSINIIHTVELYSKNEIRDIDSFLDEEMKSDIKNILKPYIDETLNYASFKIGIPRLEIPLE